MQNSLALDMTQNAPQKLPKADYDFPVNTKDWRGLALIGEAPGAEEARLGRPFVGRSGQLLDKILGQAGIDRTQCFVGNVFRLQPPANKVDHFFISKRAAVQQGVGIAERYGQFGSAWVRADYATEIDNLRDALIHLKPKMIIALGRTPMWALTGMNGLLDKVGTVIPCCLMPTTPIGTPVMPTYHPSFIMRGNWGLQDKWLGHFATAKKKII